MARGFQDTGPLRFTNREPVSGTRRYSGVKPCWVVKSELLTVGRDACIPVGQSVKISG